MARFKKLIQKTYKNSMSEQKIIFENTFNNWMNTPNNKNLTTFQVDDVLVMGVRV